ncbi:MAG: N-glycosylase/DNA lyase, partial [Nanobdellota archaeon]
MEKLINKVKGNTCIKYVVEKRLSEFKSFKNKSNKAWFSELCFCLLTANSKAKTALAIQKELGREGFCSFSESFISDCIKKNKHRFHNNKANYIVQARQYMDIKYRINSLVEKSGEKKARDWLVKSVKGLGLKEASHFLRNVGFSKLAIIDRHIINVLLEYSLIEKKPKYINKANYLEIEG